MAPGSFDLALSLGLVASYLSSNQIASVARRSWGLLNYTRNYTKSSSQGLGLRSRFSGIADPMRLSEGLSQATLVMTGARPGGIGTIPLIAAIRRHSKLCYLFYYNATSNERKKIHFLELFDSKCAQSRFEIIFLLAFY